jgi:choline-sulfatase
MPRLDLRCLLAFLAVASAPLAASPAEPPPNIVLITVDTLRPDALGWVAGKNETPAIDALAAEGFRLPRAISPVPLTLPSHTAIFSGLIPRRHGVRDNGQLVPANVALLAETLKSRGYATGAFVSGFPLRRLFGLDRGFDHYDDTLPVGAEGWLERPAPQTARAALDWVGSLGPRRPYFLWVHFYDPHDPYTPPRVFWKPGPRGAYDGEVAFADAAIGDLREGLAAPAFTVSGGSTLTVLTADHGESLGEHGESTHGFFIYDATVVVPMVFHWPGRIASRQSDAPARLVDIAPTVLDLIGAPPPKAIDGVSLKPLLSGRSQAIPSAFIESQQPWINYGWAPLSALRDLDWKLIAAPRPELFDLRQDPGELKNVVDAERPQARRLQGEMRQVETLPTASALAVEDPEVLESLRSLGYIGSGRKSSAPPAGLPDPKDRILQRNALSEAEALLRQDRFAEAIARFEVVLEEDPGNRFATLRSGIALLKAGNAKAAVPRLEKAVALDPEQAENRYALADALTRSGQLAPAAEQWMETIRLQPRRFAAWSNLGSVLGQLGQQERALGAFEKAYEIEPGNVQLRENLGAARFQAAQKAAKAGRLDAARSALKGALDLAPALRARAEAEPLLAPLLRK